MAEFKSYPSEYRSTCDGGRVVFENEYTRWEHDLARGGELAAAYVRNGTGTNLLASPQKVAVGILENGSYHTYSSTAFPPDEYQLDGAALNLTQRLGDGDGNELPGVTLKHRVQYHPWGYAVHTVRLHCGRRIEPVGQIQVGSFTASAGFDRCAVREALVESGNPVYGNSVRKWFPMTGGRSREDAPVYRSRWLPVDVLLLRRGIEGIEFSLGDDLSAWDCGDCIPQGRQLFFVGYNRTDGYEVRFCPADSLREGQFLAGTRSFTYSMALPHVRKNIVPLRVGSGGLLRFSRHFEQCWPTGADFAQWKQAGVTLMRLHNDGDIWHNGIFWRDASYPPYPPDEMRKMNECLSEAARAGIGVVPYFSVKEFHPEAEGFSDNAENWARRIDDGGMLTNDFGDSIFGAQMCLKTGWAEKRHATIDQTLSGHRFNGIYFDWCTGSECVNPAHGNGGRHWDNDALQELLEWSRRRVSPDGEVYLHLTHTPNLKAENLGTLLLTEECPYAGISPEMFTPHVHFLNIAPRQICDMLGEKASDPDRKKLAMCAMLHHAAVSSVHPVYLEFFGRMHRTDFSQFTRHTAPGEGVVFADLPETGISAYWHGN